MKNLAADSIAAASAERLEALILARRSGYAFADRPVEPATLERLFEAARWASSSRNEQPWSFVIATRERPEAFERLASTLAPANAAWAKQAPVLMLSVARREYEDNGKPNRHALHDLGQATAQLLLMATALGLATHPMGGFDVDRARELLEIPATHEPVAMIALGYPGRNQDLPEPLQARLRAQRLRHAPDRFVFDGRWGQPEAKHPSR
jgi:nitroreductase